MLVALFVFYRLNRYRAKWKEVKKRMEDAEGDGFALGMFGGGGMDDGEIEMQANTTFQDATQLQMQHVELDGESTFQDAMQQLSLSFARAGVDKHVELDDDTAAGKLENPMS